MTGHPHSRQLAHATLDTLKKAGHIVLAPGGSEQVVRDLVELIDPVLVRVLPKVNRSPIMGEVSSTFGDEATDEAVEELVSSMREALLDSDGVEDVFAEDRIIERAIFRTFADTLRMLGTPDEDEDERPPISVRLDTLGYVAAAAAKSADDETLREALDRAAEAAQSELKTFDDDTRTAFFRPVDPDPEVRFDLEEAIEEELSDLVDRGVVDLPTVERHIPLIELSEPKRKALRRKLDELAQKHLGIALCPGAWDWSEDKRSILIIFTPLTEPDTALIDRATDSFKVDLDAALGALSDEEPRSGKAGPPSSSKKGAAKLAPSEEGGADLSFVMRVLKAAGAGTSKLAASKGVTKEAKDAPKPKGAKKTSPKATSTETKPKRTKKESR